MSATSILAGKIAAREIGGKAVERLMQFIEFVDHTRGVIRSVSPSFRFHLITGDADDNKFADCAIAAEADFIITADQHFDVLRGSGYKPQPVTPEELPWRSCCRYALLMPVFR